MKLNRAAVVCNSELSLSSSLVCAHARPFETLASGVDHHGRSARLSARDLQQWQWQVMPARMLASWCELSDAAVRTTPRANLHQAEGLFVRVTSTRLTPFDTGVIGLIVCVYPDHASVSQSQLMRSMH